MPSTQDLIRSREAAEILHCDIRTIHRWAFEGRLAIAVRVSGYRGALLFDRDAVEQLALQLAAGKRTS